MKTRLKGAQKGHSLLKKKADALNMRFREILKKIVDNKILMGEVMKEAAFAMAEAKFTAGDFSHTVIQNVSQAQYRVRMKKENVVGVFLPVFECYSDGPDAYDLTGLGKGGSNITKLKKNYSKVLYHSIWPVWYHSMVVHINRCRQLFSPGLGWGCPNN